MKNIIKWASCLTLAAISTLVVSCSGGDEMSYMNDFNKSDYVKVGVCDGNYKGNWQIGQDIIGTGTMNVTADNIQITSLPLENLLHMAIDKECDIKVLETGIDTRYVQYGYSERTYYYYITKTAYMFSAMIDGKMCTVKISLEDTADNMPQAIYGNDAFVIRLRIIQIDIYGIKDITLNPAVVLTFMATRV